MSIQAKTRRFAGAIPCLTLWLMLGLCGTARANTVTYVYTDPQGTPLAEANASGVITATFDYAPYGSQAMGATHDGPGYTGHVNDADTGLVYMQARYYDPVVGRFISTDPVGPGPGNAFNFNRYAYANNNPVMNVDPDGKTCRQSGSNGSYSCQIDYVVSRVGGKVSVRTATAADHKTYSALEKSLTNAVNTASKSGKTVSVSVKIGRDKFSFKISGAKVAHNLAGRNMIVDPKGHDFGAMFTPDSHRTYINKGGISPPSHTKYGNENRTREMYFLHEGIHGSREESEGFGKALPILGNDHGAHQNPYDNAANQLLGN